MLARNFVFDKDKVNIIVTKTVIVQRRQFQCLETRVSAQKVDLTKTKLFCDRISL
jgi:hypothetical protein